MRPCSSYGLGVSHGSWLNKNYMCELRIYCREQKSLIKIKGIFFRFAPFQGFHVLVICF